MKSVCNFEEMFCLVYSTDQARGKRNPPLGNEIFQLPNLIKSSGTLIFCTLFNKKFICMYILTGFWKVNHLVMHEINK